MKDLLATFKALSDETRLRIIKLLDQDELCVCDIVAAFDMVQPKVSFHLGVLKKTGLLRDRKQGKWMRYRIDNTDLFKRFLTFSVLEKIPEEIVKQDKERLKAFLEKKEEKTDTGPANNRKVCCAARAR